MSTPPRLVRVFISSTFRDFAEERDLLVRKVFPELRRKCRERQVELVDVDLRWGITEEEAQQGKVLPICLAEIDRSRPYFIGFLGERYGWVPEVEQYDLSLLMEQPWLEEHRGGKSLTELEILHGVLDNPEMEKRAFFYFRDPAYAAAKGGAYLAEGQAEQARLAELKDCIRQSGFPVVENYASPEELAERVREDLWHLIDKAYPESEVPDALTRERMTHEAYGASRRRLYLGGEPYFAAIDAAMAAEPVRPVLVRGQSGGGKSALLANWVRGWSERHPGTSVVVHHLGSGADAADPVRMAVRLMREISRLTGDEFKPESDPEKQLEELPQWLALASAWAQRSGRELLLVLDGLDKVSAFAHLRWFPGFLPQGVKLVASCLDGEILAAVRSRLDWTELVVEPFTPKEQITFIKNYLGRYRKELTPRQSQTLLAHPLSGNPLFLLTVLEELRVFGVHEQLESRLHALLSPPPGKAPDEEPTVDDVFEHVLARIEEDLGCGGVQSAMESIWASRGGLYQDELLAIAGIAPATWAAMANALDEALYESGGRIQFTHDYLRKAVEDRYGLTTESRFRAVHHKLGDFFTKRARKENGEWDRTEQRAMLDNVYHYIKANSLNEVEKILTDFSYLIEKLRSDCITSEKTRFGCVKDFQLDDLALESLWADCRSLNAFHEVIGDSLAAWIGFIQNNFHLLRRGSIRWPTYKILLQIAIEQATTTTVAQAAESWLEQGGCDWLWLRSEESPQITKNARSIKIFETSVLGVAQPSPKILFSWDLKELKIWNLESLKAKIIGRAPVTAFMSRDGKGLVCIMRDGVEWREPESGFLIRRHHYSGGDIDGGMLLKSGDLLTWSDHDKESQIWNTYGLVGSWKELWMPETYKDYDQIHFRGYLSVDEERLIYWGDATFKIRVWNLKKAFIDYEWDPILPDLRESTGSHQEVGTFSVQLLESGDILTDEYFENDASLKRWSAKDYQFISGFRVNNEKFVVLPLDKNRIAVLNHELGAPGDSYIFDFDFPKDRILLDVPVAVGGRLLHSRILACWTLSEATIHFFNLRGNAIGSVRSAHRYLEYLNVDDGFNLVDSPSGEFLTYSSVDQTIKIWDGYGSCEKVESKVFEQGEESSPAVYAERDFLFDKHRNSSVYCVFDGGFQLTWTPFQGPRYLDGESKTGSCIVVAPEGASFKFYQVGGLDQFQVSSLQLLWNGFQLNCYTDFFDGRCFREILFRVVKPPPQYRSLDFPVLEEDVCKVRFESTAKSVEVFPDWNAARGHAKKFELGWPLPSASWEADTAYRLRWIDAEGRVVLQDFTGAWKRLMVYYGSNRLICEEVVNLCETIKIKMLDDRKSCILDFVREAIGCGLSDWNAFSDVIDTLSERESEILKQRFGLRDGYIRTLEEVGRQLQLPAERIRQIEAKALRKMRHPTRLQKLEGFIEVPNAGPCGEASVRQREQVSKDDPDDVPMGLADLIARNLDDED